MRARKSLSEWNIARTIQEIEIFALQKRMHKKKVVFTLFLEVEMISLFKSKSRRGRDFALVLALGLCEPLLSLKSCRCSFQNLVADITFRMTFIRNCLNVNARVERAAALNFHVRKPANKKLSEMHASSQKDCESEMKGYFLYRQTEDFHRCSHVALLDVRSRTDFESGHLLHSTSIPLDELSQRLYELPPPFEEPIGLLGSDTKQLEEARKILERHRWTIDQEILSEVLVGKEPIVKGGSSRPIWKPNELLDEFFRSEKGREWYSRRKSGVALDIGCGAGRDAVLMARILGPSWLVVGVDNDAGVSFSVHQVQASLSLIRC